MSGTTFNSLSLLGLTVSGTAETSISIGTTGTLEPSSSPAIYADAPQWRLFNQGGIIGGSGAPGIYLETGSAYLANQGYINGISGTQAYITLQNTGQINGHAGAGVSAAGSIPNRGTISDAQPGGIGVALTSGALLNGRIGLVNGAYEGVYLSGTGSAANLGTIEGGQGAGLVLAEGGMVVNGASTVQSAVIHGRSSGVSLKAGGTIINYAQISGFIGLYGGSGMVENRGLITGGTSLQIAIPFTGYTYVSGAGLILAGGTLQNSGTVLGGGIPVFPLADSGTAGAGITLDAGLIINTGSIAGAAATGSTLSGGNGVLAAGGTIANSGIISGGAAYQGGDGLVLFSGAYGLNNGTIQGGAGTFGGAGALLQGGTLVNTGSLSGGDGTSWNWSPGLAAGAVIYTGLLINAGNITGGAQQHLGADLGAGTLSNSGTISGAIGVLEQSGLTENTGLIQGSAVGVELWSGVLANAGTITGPYAVYMAAAAQTLVVDPGASFQGEVLAQGATLELAGGTGTLDMGASFSGFSAIAFAQGADWTLAGSIAQLAGGEIITGFTQGDTLELEGFTASGAAYVPGVGLEISNGTSFVTISLAASGLIATPDATGTRIAICYAKGTRITTAQGQRPVEDLAIGDMLPTYFGGMQRIKWIGRQNFTAAALQGDRERAPVRIMANALGPGQPRRDLFISPGHSILLDGRLILAKYLVNGLTITQPAPARDVAYYLVEFAGHDCILAEGIWAESFADGPGLRGNFHNEAEFHRLYPDYAAPGIITLCAARPEQGPQLEAALRPVAARAGHFHPGALRGFIERIEGRHVEGWAQDIAWPDLPQILQISAGGTVLGEALACHYRPDLAASIGQGRAHFTFMAQQDVSPASLRVHRLADGAELKPLA